MDDTGFYPLRLRVYANEGVPVSLSSPVALGSVKRLTKTTFETELLGGQDDPVEGFLINWTIASGPGTLLHSQSTTGIDGKATVEYLGPEVITGDVTIHAEVVY